MSNGVSLSIEGGADLQKQLEGLSEEVTKKVAMRAIRAGTRLMLEAIRSNAPVGPGTPKLRRTKTGDIVVMDYGHLKDNLRVRMDSKRARAAAQGQGLFELMITAGAAFWGRFVEEGTAKMAARPWMRPAFDSNTAAATDKVGEELSKGIDAWVRKNARGK